jgi:ATP-dependent helicase HrpA
LKALDRRIAKFIENPARDARHAATIAEWWRRYRERVERNRQAGRMEPKLDGVPLASRGALGLAFAQELKTPFPVSYKRLERAFADLDR